MTHGGVWATVYCLMFCLSAFLVMQTLEAMLFRFLLLAVPALLAWRYAATGAPVDIAGRAGPAISGARP